MTSDPKQISRHRSSILGIGVDVIDYDRTVANVVELARSGEGGYIVVANVHVTIEAEDDPEFATLVDDADLVLPDGTPLVWMQRLLGRQDATQVRGPSLMPLLLRTAENEMLRVGFLGGSPEVLERIVERGRDEFPELDIEYFHSPPFRPLSPDENRKIAQDINAAKVQILFVGLGCPKQERWMAANRDQVDAVMLGVGAAFDLYAGSLREAPELIRRLGLEWFFRLIQEPRRLFSRYLLVNPRFSFLAAKQLIKRRLIRQPDHSAGGRKIESEAGSNSLSTDSSER